MAESTPIGFEAKIAPQLADLIRPLTDCQPHPENARKHNLPNIARSLHAHGQRSAIVVQASTGYVVKGNGTWTAAAQLLGWDRIAQSWQDLNDDEAMAYLLADNKASDDSGYDTKKLTKALSKMAEGPGLLDTLWNDVELEDLIEADAQPTLLSPETQAAYADAATVDKREARGAAQGTKMKETPIVLSVEDHARFVGYVNELRKRFGTGGVVATIFEAIKRQAEAEEGVELIVGRAVDPAEHRKLRRELVVELRNIITTLPDEQITRARLYALLEHAAPPVNSPLRQVPGQTEAFEATEGDEGGSQGEV